MKSGFVCLVGSPNVGKSTMVNSIIGKKISIVSKKPQTTRHRINAIWNAPNAQVVFVDTPGLHKAVHKLGKYLVKIAINSLEGNDLLLFVTSAEGVKKSDEIVAERISNVEVPFIGVVNKCDLKENLAVKSIDSMFTSMKNCVGVHHISAINRTGIDELIGEILKNLPEAPAYYPIGTLTDRPLNFMISEIVREKVFRFTREELPYSSAVVVDYTEETPDLMKIWVTILVDKSSQKPIMLGKGGKMIKKIGTFARKDIERLVDKHVFLSVHVKVKPKWTESDKMLEEMFRGELK